MSLITCPECGRENVSDHAEACPNCGYPISMSSSLDINNIDSSKSVSLLVDREIKVNETTESMMAPTYTKKNNTKNITIIAVVCLVLFGVSYIYYATTRCKIQGCNNKKMSSSEYCVEHFYDSYKYGYEDSLGDYDYKYNNYNYNYNANDYSSYSSNNITTGNEGALNKAKSYLRSSAFSYSGLIDQLEFCGFTESEAKYGADNCGADWYEQAELKAKSYLRSSSFSYNGLIDQLEFTGFTESEAKYGADNCGADWFDQAVKKAKSYRKSSGFSGSRLVEQLEYTGFTQEQAEYGERNTQ